MTCLLLCTLALLAYVCLTAVQIRSQADILVRELVQPGLKQLQRLGRAASAQDGIAFRKTVSQVSAAPCLKVN